MNENRAQETSKLGAAKVRVLVNALHAKSGGGLTYLAAMLPRLAQASGVEIHLLFHANQKKLLGALPSGVITHEAVFKDGFIRRLAWEQLALPFLAWRIADVTFSPANFGPLFAPRPVVLLRNALEVEDYDARFAKRVYWLALRLMTWLSLLTAPKAIAVSGYAKRKLGMGLGAKIDVVYHGVEHEIFHPDQNERNDFVLAVGDITIQKNYATLISAIGSLPEIELRIVGQRIDEKHARSLDAQVARLGLEGRVTFLGRLEQGEIAALYRTCRIFAFPSTVETFGNPLVEAMASGCPVLCSRTTAVPEIAGDAAHYVDALDPSSWAQGIRLLTESQGERRLLERLSLERAKLFAWDAAAEKTCLLLSRAANGTPHPVLAPMAALWIFAILFAYFWQFHPLLGLILAALSRP